MVTDTSRTRTLRRITAALCVVWSLGLAACGGDDVEENNGANNGAACPAGEVQNPITGDCVPEAANNTSANNGATGQCPMGETYNPVLGVCEDAGNNTSANNTSANNSTGNNGATNNTSTNNTSANNTSANNTSANNTSANNTSANNSTGNNTSANNTGMMDMGPVDPCESPMVGVDTDGDGLDDPCECDYGTELDNPDTDGDGLTDGEEDADKSCRISTGESDARYADTDGDGVGDKEEADAGTNPLLLDSDNDGIDDGVEINSCLDPLSEDTDGDGIPDGIEDGNKDGKIGTCPMRAYDPACAAGESDPCAEDTDGDGTVDTDEVLYRTCRDSDKQNLTQPQLLVSMAGDYQLATELSVTTSPLSSMSGAAVEGHVFEDPTHYYTGFVVSLTPPMGFTEAPLLADHVFNQVKAIPDYAMVSRRSAGRQITTHDGYKAIVDGIVDLPAGTSPEDARDKILAQLTGVSDLTHSLSATTTVGPAEPTLFHYEVVARGMNDYVLVGVLAPLGREEDDALETGFRVDDLVGGASVAGAMETLEADCVSFKVTERPKVDIIISMDASGSMQDEQMALANFVTDLTTFLNAANLDWRIGVTSVACSNITGDMALSMEFRALWPSGGGGFFPMGPCSAPIGGGFGGTTNGALVKQSQADPGFTTNVSDIQWRISNVNGTNSEYTMTMGIAAIDRALPRQPNAPNKIREGAAIVMIAVTDEEDDYFKETLSFLPKENLTASERTQLEMETAPFVDYLLRADVGATVFGLYNVPNANCPTAAQFASAIHDVVNKTGGNGGSICQSDITTSLQAITSATAGIASGLRLRGAPVAPSIVVKHAQVMSGMEVEIQRSRLDGFDYDGIVNRVAFFGPNPPQTNDRLVIPYLRWGNSIAQCMTDDDCPAEQKYQCIDGECR